MTTLSAPGHRNRTLLLPFLAILAVLWSLASAPAQAFGSSGNSLFGNSNGDFLPVDEALPFSFTTDQGAVVLSWDIAPEHYLYKSRIQVSALTDGVTLGAPEFSLPATLTEDEFFGEMEVFFDPIQARVPVNLPEGVREAELQVTYQGCAEAGLCYPPQTQDVLYYAGSGGSSTPTGGTSNSAGGFSSGSGADTSSASGLASFLSSQSIWMIAGLLGASYNLQAQLQSPWVLGVFATLFVLFALSMFDMFEIQLPRFIREPLNDASQKLTGGRILSLFGIGALSALIVSPCVSAPLAGSLLYISTTQDAVIGGVALLSLGLGMGVPLILVAVGGRKLLPTSGQWMTTVKHFYGVMLLAVAIWLIERMIPVWASLTLWGLLIAITGVQLGAFDAARAGWERTRKGLGLVLFAYGLALLAGAVGGASDPLRPLAPFVASAGTVQDDAATEAHAPFLREEDPEQIRAMLADARSAGQPVMLDFYADWCISCKVMERNVFSKQDVIQALEPYTLLQIDMTDNTRAQQALLDELGLFGPPATLFYRSNGEEMGQARILGEMNRQQFMDHLGKVAQES